MDFFELPQSGDQAAMLLLDTTTGNTGVPGFYVFEVRNVDGVPGVTLTGGAGNDILTGAAGDDAVIGLDGADTLTCGAGRDILTGDGDGSSNPDIFVFAAGDGGATIPLADVITDFKVGVDLIKLTGELTFDDLFLEEFNAVGMNAPDTVISVIEDEVLVEVLVVVDGVHRPYRVRLPAPPPRSSCNRVSRPRVRRRAAGG